MIRQDTAFVGRARGGRESMIDSVFVVAPASFKCASICGPEAEVAGRVKYSARAKSSAPTSASAGGPARAAPAQVARAEYSHKMGAAWPALTLKTGAAKWPSDQLDYAYFARPKCRGRTRVAELGVDELVIWPLGAISSGRPNRDRAFEWLGRKWRQLNQCIHLGAQLRGASTK